MVRKRNKNLSADLPVLAPCEGVPDDVGISGGACASSLAPHQALCNAAQKQSWADLGDSDSSDARSGDHISLSPDAPPDARQQFTTGQQCVDLLLLMKTQLTNEIEERVAIVARETIDVVTALKDQQLASVARQEGLEGLFLYDIIYIYIYIYIRHRVVIRFTLHPLE